MKSIAIIAALVLFPAASHAQDKPPANKYISSMKEMRRMVSEKSPSRQLLYCAVLSSNLHNYDMYGLFVRKASTETHDADAFQMALAYMMGFFESEALNLKDQPSSTEDTGKVLGAIYATQCMKYTLPAQP